MPGTGPLNIASPDCAEAFFGADRVVRLWHAASLKDLYEVLHARLDDPPTAGGRTLDLIGHSTREHRLLRLGGTPVDMLDPFVFQFFQAVAAERLLPRLRITAVRLLGCETAVTESGRMTVRLLGKALDLPVYGTLKPLLKSHSTAAGFHPSFEHLLSDCSPG
jgi:hypothetical protein